MNMRIHLHLRPLIAAIALMTMGLLASVMIMSRVSRTLFDAHRAIAENSAPTVVVLDTAQAHLRRLHMLVVEQMLGAPGDPGVRSSAIETARRGLAHDMELYSALPIDPGEVSLVGAIRESLAQLNDVVDRAIASAPRGDASELGLARDLDSAVGDLGLDLARASEFSADLATRSAARVAGVYHTDLPIAAGILALTFVAGAGTLALTYRAVRRAEALAGRSLAAVEGRAEELEAFAGRVAHDLLSPLMVVSLALDLADRRLTGAEDGAARSAVERAVMTLQRVRRFVSDLLEFARAGARPPPGVRAGVEEAIHDVAEELTPIARDAGVDLRVEPLPAGRVVACSPGVLSSLLSNLLQNAIKFIGGGEERRVTVRALDAGGEVRVEVEDTGPGVDPEDRTRLFEPYARGRDAKAPGLGLGLATVRRLVESHGGHVGVRSAPGHGSVFWFSLPVAA